MPVVATSVVGLVWRAAGAGAGPAGDVFLLEFTRSADGTGAARRRGSRGVDDWGSLRSAVGGGAGRFAESALVVAVSGSVWSAWATPGAARMVSPSATAAALIGFLRDIGKPFRIF